MTSHALEKSIFLDKVQVQNDELRTFFFGQSLYGQSLCEILIVGHASTVVSEVSDDLALQVGGGGFGKAPICVNIVSSSITQSKCPSSKASPVARTTGVLEAGGITISMDGRARVFDNIFVERLWRSVKCEEVYLKEYGSVREARSSIGAYFRFYNTERLHQALRYKTPCEIYTGARTKGRHSMSIRQTARRTSSP